jgi:hypothetical protein
MSRAKAALPAVLVGLAIAVLALIVFVDLPKQVVGVLGTVLGATISATVALQLDLRRLADGRNAGRKTGNASGCARTLRERARQAAIPLHSQFGDVAGCLRSGYWPAEREVRVDLPSEERGAIASQVDDFWLVVHWALQTMDELADKAETERRRVKDDAVGLEGFEAKYAATRLEQGVRALGSAARNEAQVELDRQEREEIADSVMVALERKLADSQR